MATLDIDLNDFGADVELPQDFTPASEGRHHAHIVNAELTTTKTSNKPMLVVDWQIDGDDDPDNGKVVTDRLVLFIKNRRSGGQQLHWLLPNYFKGVGMWPADVASRQKLFSGANLNSTFEKLLGALDGVGGTLSIIHEEGDVRRDEMGNPRLDENGNELRFTNVNTVVENIEPKKTKKRKLA